MSFLDRETKHSNNYNSTEVIRLEGNEAGEVARNQSMKSHQAGELELNLVCSREPLKVLCRGGDVRGDAYSGSTTVGWMRARIIRQSR